MHTFCLSLTKFSFMKSVQTRFVVPRKQLIDTFLLIKVIISYNNFITMRDEKIWARFSLSDFSQAKI